MREDCRRYRDDLPLLAAGRLEAAAVQRLEAHLAGCADCRAEQAVLRVLCARLPASPALHARVRRSAIAMPRSMPAFARAALAAGIATLVLAGALVLGRSDAGTRIATAPDSATTTAADLGWAARTDPLLHGGPGLDALSEAELAQLLEEMQS